MNPAYPIGTVRALIQSDAVTPATRQVLAARLDSTPQPWRFFDQAEQATLRAVCARLFPQPDRQTPIDLATCIDARLADGKGDGWRYEAMPPDPAAYRLGLRGLDEASQVLAGRPFALLDAAHQDSILCSVHDGTAPGATWKTLPARLFFEELLAEATENYYAHPLAQEEIGYAGFADAPGWKKIGLGEREDREPPAIQVLVSAPLPLQPSIPRLESTRRFDLSEEVDALVIGTGAGGAPLLARLAQAGLKVVALEAGQGWNPTRDFATDEKSQSGLFWNDERLSAGDDPLHFGANNSGIGVGGSTLHYTAYTPRVQPDDLRLHSEFGVGCDWPISYSDLEPYYDELELFLGISGPKQYPWGPPRNGPYPLPALPFNASAQLMQRGCEALGIQTSPAANAALSAPYFQKGVGWRAACTNRGFCQAG